MAEKSQLPPRKRRKKGQVTIQILVQPAQHVYPLSLDDIPILDSTTNASTTTTLPVNSHISSADPQQQHQLLPLYDANLIDVCAPMKLDVRRTNRK